MPIAAVHHQLEQLEGKLQEHTDFLNRLKSAPDSDVQIMLRKLRSTDNVSNVLSSLKGAAHTAARISDEETARAVIPSTISAVEFELGVLHQFAFPVLTPLELICIGTEEYFQADQGAFLSDFAATYGQDIIGDPLTASERPPLRGIFPSRTSAVVGPLEDRQYCDARLNKLKVDYWTKIPISDEFAASILSYHFETYHAIFGCVDCDLFLSDLVGHKLDYCSPFLVAAILSLACVCLYPC